MKAVLGTTVIAEAPKEELLRIEGNYYFPPSSVQERVPREEPDALHLPLEGRVPVLHRRR